VVRRLGGSKDSLSGMWEIVTCGQETWWVQGQSQRYVGDSNMRTGDLVGPRTVLAVCGR